VAPSLISPLKSRRPGQGPYVAEMRRIGIEGDSGGIVSFEVTPEPQGRPRQSAVVGRFCYFDLWLVARFAADLHVAFILT